MEATRPISMIPSDCFRWQPRVQFIDSFRTREAALNCAFEKGYNLIVERSEGKSVLFDVLDDPEGACTSGLELELLQTEEVIVDPYSEGWFSLMVLSTWNLTRRLGAALAALYVRYVVPRLRQAASRRTREAITREVRRAWRKMTRTSRPGVLKPTWHSPIPASCKVKTVSLSTARVYARRFAVRAAAFYHQQVVPFCRSAASRAWWSGPAITVRRRWHRYSQGSVSDAASRLAAVVSSLYNREIAPRLRQAAIQIRQADYKGAFRRALSVSLSTGRDLSRRFAAASSNLYQQEVSPRLRHAAITTRQANYKAAFRRAWSFMLLATIRLVDRFVATVAGLYVRQVAPRLRRAAARYQQAEIEDALRRSMVPVAPPQHSNSSQLG